MKLTTSDPLKQLARAGAVLAIGVFTLGSTGVGTPAGNGLAAHASTLQPQAVVAKAPVAPVVVEEQRVIEDTPEAEVAVRQTTTASSQPAVYGADTGDVFARIRKCESGGNYATNTGNGYYGAYQFNMSTWRAYGGNGNPASASPSEQDRVAANLYAKRGAQPWPTCGRR